MTEKWFLPDPVPELCERTVEDLLRNIREEADFSDTPLTIAPRYVVWDEEQMRKWFGTHGQ